MASKYDHLASEWVRLYTEEGKSLKELAAQFDVSASVVRSVLLKYGTPLRPRGAQRSPLTPEERFWSKVDQTPGYGPNGDCWEWQGARSTSIGYGSFGVDGKHVLAHRFSYELHKGPIRNQVNHYCDNPACVNPAHLYDGSQQQNAEDMVARDRQTKGSRNPQSVLDEQVVRDIRRRAQAGVNYEDLSIRYGVDSYTISRAVRGMTWKHV